MAAHSIPNALSAEQVRASLNQARDGSTRDWCLPLLTFRHALRSQEVRHLKLADIDLQNLTIISRKIVRRCLMKRLLARQCYQNSSATGRQREGFLCEPRSFRIDQRPC